MPIFNYGISEISHLSQRDPQLACVIADMGMLEREITPDLFSALLKSIVAQQIATKTADSIWGKLCANLGDMQPSSIAQAELASLQNCGLSQRKAQWIKNIADKTVTGELDFTALAQLPDDSFIKTLSSLSGVGVWTAEMLLIFSLTRPDVVSWGDLAIRRGMMNVYGLSELNKTQFMHYRANYSPYGTVASLYLWAASAQQKPADKKNPQIPR
jgi:3-methyladenine DNA glycosylase/8-oxoguanine DNA glycosylase